MIHFANSSIEAGKKKKKKHKKKKNAAETGRIFGIFNMEIIYAYKRENTDK